VSVFGEKHPTLTHTKQRQTSAPFSLLQSFTADDDTAACCTDTCTQQLSSSSSSNSSNRVTLIVSASQLRVAGLKRV
jgi:hypothetical protein